MDRGAVDAARVMGTAFSRSSPFEQEGHAVAVLPARPASPKAPRTAQTIQTRPKRRQRAPDCRQHDPRRRHWPLPTTRPSIAVGDPIDPHCRPHRSTSSPSRICVVDIVDPRRRHRRSALSPTRSCGVDIGLLRCQPIDRSCRHNDRRRRHRPPVSPRPRTAPSTRSTASAASLTCTANHSDRDRGPHNPRRRQRKPRSPPPRKSIAADTKSFATHTNSLRRQNRSGQDA